MLRYQLLSTLRAIVKKSKSIKMSFATFGNVSCIYGIIDRGYCELLNLLTIIVDPWLL